MGKAPKPDPAMAIAAEMSAETGREMMAFMKDQSKITNKWAADDRSRYETTFQPLENQFAMDAQAANDPRNLEANADARASEAVGDVRQQFALQRGADDRRLRSMGVRPDSGRDAALSSSRGSAEALAAAGASNIGRRNATATAEGMRANAINLGKGMAVNPGTSMGLSNNAAQSGFGGAMSGYGQQAGILKSDFDARTTAWEGSNAMMGGLGQAAGMVIGMSSKTYKEDMKPAKDSLGAIRKMPVGDWKYKDGIADGGRHVGPYAEDFAKATGKGDGKSIDMMSMMGVTLGALQELDKKVGKMEKGKAA